MSKLKGIRLENEVDKCRGDCNWKRLQELLPQVKARGSGLESAFSFFYGEWVLEKYLDDLVTFPSPDSSHKETLKKAEKFLMSVFEDQSDANLKPHVALEAHLLLAKIHYVCAEFEAAISSVQKARLDREDIQFHTLRTLRLVAEAYAIKGLSIDRQSANSTSRYQRAVREEQILAAFEKASDLALSYIGELEKASTNAPGGAVTPTATMGLPPPSLTNWSSPIERVGFLMETALQRVPLMYIEQGWSGEAAAQAGFKQLCLERGVEQYRKVLTVSDKPVAHHLHQRLCRQLAEVLVRGVSDVIYMPPILSPSTALKAKQLRFYLGSPAFCPLTKFHTSFMSCRKEELLLILAISESIAAREAVLSRAEDEEPLRQASHEDVKAVQNLLTLVLAGLGQYGLLSGILERALKFAFQDAFVWLQFAYSLASAQRYSRAALVLKECLGGQASSGKEWEEHDDPKPYLMAANICLEHLGDYQESIRFAQIALDLASNGWLRGRAELVLGLAWSVKGQASAEYLERKKAAAQALDHLRTAVEADPRDALPHFFLALQLALLRDTAAAKAACLKSLSLDWEQPSAYMLLALLLTTTGDYIDALHVVEEALSEHPNHYGLLVLRLKLQMSSGDAREALSTARDLLLFWKLRGGPFSPIQATSGTLEPRSAGENDAADSGINASSLFVNQATIPRSLSDMGGDKDSIMGGGGTATGGLSEYGGAASTVGSSLGITNSSGHVERRSVAAQWRVQANVWLELAEMFLEAGRMSDVSVCVEEATSAFPNSHQTLYLRGRILKLRADEEVDEERRSSLLEEAKGAFLGSLALSPHHLPSLRHLASAYHKEGNLRMAEKILKDVLRTEPVEEGCWSGLGRVLGEWSGREAEAADAFSTAALLQASAPLLPYSVIPRIVHL